MGVSGVLSFSETTLGARVMIRGYSLSFETYVGFSSVSVAGGLTYSWTTLGARIEEFFFKELTVGDGWVARVSLSSVFLLSFF